MYKEYTNKLQQALKGRYFKWGRDKHKEDIMKFYA